MWAHCDIIYGCGYALSLSLSHSRCFGHSSSKRFSLSCSLYLSFFLSRLCEWFAWALPLVCLRRLSSCRSPWWREGRVFHFPQMCSQSIYNFVIVIVHIGILRWSILYTGEGPRICCSSWDFFHFALLKGFLGGVFPYLNLGSRDRGCHICTDYNPFRRISYLIMGYIHTYKKGIETLLFSIIYLILYCLVF